MLKYHHTEGTIADSLHNDQSPRSAQKVSKHGKIIKITCPSRHLLRIFSLWFLNTNLDFLATIWANNEGLGHIMLMNELFRHHFAVPEVGGGGRGSGPLLKNHKIQSFLELLVRIPWKLQSCQASIQCLDTVGMPAKRHLMAFCWRANEDPPLVVFGSSYPSSTKTKTKTTRTPLTKFSGSAHVITVYM